MPRMDKESDGTSDAAADAVQQRARRRGVVLAIAVVVSLVVAVSGGWGLASAFESPAQREAAARPPAPGAVTATVTKGDLSEKVNAKASFSRSIKQSIPLAAGGAGSVITAITAAPGLVLKPGGIALEINGRPLFAFPGTFPFYRDLEAGSSGPDVKQLQSGLAAAGYKVIVDGKFGPATTQAVTALYARAGYDLPTSGPDATAPGAGGAEQTPSDAQPSAATPPILTVPLIEVVVIGSLPATVTSTPPLGSAIGDGSTLTLEHGEVVATASVAGSVSPRLRKGMVATIRTDKGEQIDATVDVIVAPDKTGDNATVSLLSASGPIADALLNSQGLATITIERAARDSILVPASAIVTGGTGQSYVLKQTDGDRFTKIPVREVATLAGRSAITVTDADLKVGDHVKVG